MENEKLEYLHGKALKLPLLPGVYRMRNKAGKIIYIGKAKSLKNRVTSYFRNVETHTEKTYKLVSLVDDFDFIVTENEFEALILECSQIKEYNPKYNIKLKDARGYTYIRVSPGPYSRISAEKSTHAEGSFLGPYASSFVVRETVDEANGAFMLPVCSRVFPRDFRKERPCLNFFIKKCMGVCRGNISEEAYNEAFENALNFIKNGADSAIGRLTGQMEAEAEALNFEKAAGYRDRIRALRKIADQQKVIYAGEKEQDTIAFAQSDSRVCAVVLSFRHERLSDKRSYIFADCKDIGEVRQEFPALYYQSNADIPGQVCMDKEFEGLELLSEYLTQLKGGRVRVSVPKKGSQLRLIEMAHSNAVEQLSISSEISGRDISALEELAKLFGLKKTPQVIEAYDISNIGSDTVVAGMAVFENGRPKKEHYRKFKLEGFFAPDDYRAVNEVIFRRIGRYFSDKEDGAFSRLPDLILIDGGKGQLSAAMEAMKGYPDFDPPVFAMQKNDRHKTKSIVGPNGEINLQANKAAYTAVSNIQEEVHRFAISFSRSRHQKNALQLKLTTIPNIGPKKAAALFARFKTMAAMEKATVEDIMEAEGFSRKSAEALYRHLHEGHE